jgi:hypothetical protein
VLQNLDTYKSAGLDNMDSLSKMICRNCCKACSSSPSCHLSYLKTGKLMWSSPSSKGETL